MAQLSQKKQIVKLYFNGYSLTRISNRFSIRFDEVIDIIDSYLIQRCRPNSNYKGPQNEK